MLKYLLVILLFSCARSPLKNQVDATRRTDKEFKIEDQLDKTELIAGVKASIEQLKIHPKKMDFGPVSIQSKEYLSALEKIVFTYEKDPIRFDWDSYILENFDVLEVYGQKDWAEVYVTGYYTPVFKASEKKTDKFDMALYGKPKDLVTIKIKSYRETFDNLDIKVDNRVVSSMKGRVDENQKVIPFWTREEINNGKLIGKDLELAWMDSVEAFFLQIQGSGKLVLDNKKEMYVHYGDQNGHPYHAIGKDLLDVIPLEEMSMDRIKSHLYSLPKEERIEILNKDPSFVFFKAEDYKPKTFFGTTVVSGRTIATDSYFYPKGVLGYLKIDDPNAPIKSRLILDEDRGGGIKGGYRVDLYMGEGEEIGSVAGKLKQPAKLYYFIPKKR